LELNESPPKDGLIGLYSKSAEAEEQQPITTNHTIALFRLFMVFSLGANENAHENTHKIISRYGAVIRYYN
jgi:hypothetical protein